MNVVRCKRDFFIFWSWNPHTQAEQINIRSLMSRNFRKFGCRLKQDSAFRPLIHMYLHDKSAFNARRHLLKEAIEHFFAICYYLYIKCINGSLCDTSSTEPGLNQFSFSSVSQQRRYLYMQCKVLIRGKNNSIKKKTAKEKIDEKKWFIWCSILKKKLKSNLVTQNQERLARKRYDFKRYRQQML